MITKFENKHDETCGEITIEEIKKIYNEVGFDISKEPCDTNSDIIKSILKLGISELLLEKDVEYDPNELSQVEIYTGIESKMYTPYIISKDAFKINAVVWIVSSAIALSSYDGLKPYIVSCVGNLFNTYFLTIKKLNSQEKCVFFRIYYLHEICNKMHGASIEEIASFAAADDPNTQFCFIANQIKCNKRNPENEILCAANIDVPAIVKCLLEKNAIKEIDNKFIPYSVFI